MLSMLVIFHLCTNYTLILGQREVYKKTRWHELVVNAHPRTLPSLFCHIHILKKQQKECATYTECLHTGLNDVLYNMLWDRHHLFYCSPTDMRKNKQDPSKNKN